MLHYKIEDFCEKLRLKGIRFDQVMISLILAGFFPIRFSKFLFTSRPALDMVILLIIFAGKDEYIRNIQNSDFLKKPSLFYFRFSHFDIGTIFFTILSQNLG